MLCVSALNTVRFHDPSRTGFTRGAPAQGGLLSKKRGKQALALVRVGAAVLVNNALRRVDAGNIHGVQPTTAHPPSEIVRPRTHKIVIIRILHRFDWLKQVFGRRLWL